MLQAFVLEVSQASVGGQASSNLCYMLVQTKWKCFGLKRKICENFKFFEVYLRLDSRKKHGCSLIQKQVLVSIPNFPSNILFRLQKVSFAYQEMGLDAGSLFSSTLVFWAHLCHCHFQAFRLLGLYCVAVVLMDENQKATAASCP